MPPLHWQYSVAQDIEITEDETGIVFHMDDGLYRVATGNNTRILELLGGERIDESLFEQELITGKAEENAASVLYQLDRLGVLNRHLSESGRLLISCLPLRAPPSPIPDCLPERKLSLSKFAYAHRVNDYLCLENPGQWATVTLHDRALSSLLHDLSFGKSAGDIITDSNDFSAEALQAVLNLLVWCGILDTDEDSQWSVHEQLFHSRTRAGYTRHFPGKSARISPPLEEEPRREYHDRAGCIKFEKPNPLVCDSTDPPYSEVSRQRRSIRVQGSKPIHTKQLSEFLFRTVGEQQGRRAYPSGGSCYPINTYVAIRACEGIHPGFYRYEPVRHELVSIRQSCPLLERLMTQAARTADITLPPQVLLVLACRMSRIHSTYPELGYSLALKEVGAIYQAAMMNAAAMQLASCPLGCGDSLLFAELVGIDPAMETSMGELMLGSKPSDS